ncbi:MAG: hypothetical protein WD737_08370 [Gemmatimonadota bacterium]
MLRSLTTLFALLSLVVVSTGCDSFLSPEAATVVPDGELPVARVAPDAPPLNATEVSFWAVRGEAREVEIRYATEAGYNGKCLRFVVPAQALLRHADGSVVEPGDSVQITVRVLDPQQFLFEFDPGGLRFDAAHPARLEVRYRWADDDVNGDGAVDDRDAEDLERLQLWRQESPGEPWTKLPSTHLAGIQEVHADITGFTRYALASDRRPDVISSGFGN